MSSRDRTYVGRDEGPGAHGDMEPPAGLVWISVAVLAVGVVVLFLGAVHVGVTVDEGYHVVRLRNFLDHGWYLLDGDLHRGVPTGEVADAMVYAPVATLVMHCLNVAVGNEGWASVATSADAYAVRHVAVALISLPAVAATSSLTSWITGSVRWGLVSAAILVAFPSWTGHAMFNVKDIPVATGYTLVTASLVALARRRPGPVATLVAAAALVAGVLLSVGTRPAVWVGVGGAVVLFCAHSVVHRNRRGATVCLLSLAVAGLALLWVYPVVFADPAAWLTGSAAQSAGYDGVRNRWYLPVAVLVAAPTVLCTLALMGWVVLLLEARRRRRLVADEASDPGRARLAVALVTAQATLFPLAVIVSGASVSGGVRHVLLAAPAVAVLVTSGVRRLFMHSSDPHWRLTTATLAMVGLVLPVTAQVQMFPYGYAATGEAAELPGRPPNGDYWRASYREFAPELPPGAFVVCSPARLPDGKALRVSRHIGVAVRAASDDCRTDPIGPLAPYQEDLDTYLATPGAVLRPFVAVFPSSWQVGTNCTVLDEVVRRQLIRRAPIAVLARCSLALPDLPEEGIDLRSRESGPHLLDGWRVQQPDGCLLVDAEVSSLGFAVPPDGGHSPMSLRLDIINPAGTVIWVDGQRVRSLGDTDMVVVPVPPAALDDGQVVLSLTGSPDAGLCAVQVESRAS